jgi:hypothetical protein
VAHGRPGARPLPLAARGLSRRRHRVGGWQGRHGRRDWEGCSNDRKTRRERGERHRPRAATCPPASPPRIDWPDRDRLQPRWLGRLLPRRRRSDRRAQRPDLRRPQRQHRHSPRHRQAGREQLPDRPRNRSAGRAARRAGRQPRRADPDDRPRRARRVHPAAGGGERDLTGEGAARQPRTGCSQRRHGVQGADRERPHGQAFSPPGRRSRPLTVEGWSGCRRRSCWRSPSPRSTPGSCSSRSCASRD